MPLPGFIALANTFGQWLNATNNLTSHVDNTSVYVLVSQNATPRTSTGNISLSGTIQVGSNVWVDQSSVFTGNSTVNASHTATSVVIANSTSTSTLNPTTLTIGSTTLNAVSYTGNITGTAANATNLNSQPGSYYTNASNLSTGTLPLARLDANVILTTSTTGMNASALSTGTVPDGRITGAYTGVTSLAVGSNVVANVTTIFVGNSTANVSHTATSLVVANTTNTATLTPISLTIGTQVANTTGIYAGANVYLTPTTVFVGNSTVNATHLATSIAVANSTNTATLTPISLTIGTSVVNTTATSLGGTLAVTGATNALSTLGVGGVFTALGTSTLTGAATLSNTASIAGAANALGTLGVGGVFTALSTSGHTGAATFSNTVSITGAANALGTLGVGGVFTALSTTTLTGAVTLNSSLTAGSQVVNATGFYAGANVYLTPTTVFVGNSTVNAVHLATSIAVANSTNTATLTPTTLTIGSTVMNTQSLQLTTLTAEAFAVKITGPSADVDGIRFVDSLSTAVVTQYYSDLYLVSGAYLRNRGGSGTVYGTGTRSVEQIQLGSDGIWFRVAPSGTINTLATMTLALKVNTTFVTASVPLSATSTLGVTGATTLSNTLSVTGAANALGTLGVGGTFSALGQMSVTANANFDSGTLFVDAVNNRVGVNNSTPSTALEVTGTVTATALSGNGIAITSVNASNITTGSLAYTRLATTSAGYLLMGNATGGVQGLQMTGDVTISSTGVTAIGSGVIVDADISGSAAIAHSKLAGITAGSLLMGNASSLPQAIAMSGDVTIGSTGVTAIGSGKVTSAMILDGTIVNADINDSAAIAVSKLAASTISGVTLGNSLNSATFNNGGAGGASGSTYNGSAALTVSYNTVGAPSTTGTGASGNWNINAKNITDYTINQNLGTGNSPTFAGLIVSATGKLYVDGGGDTYIDEKSANIMRFIAGGGTIMEAGTSSGAYLLVVNGMGMTTWPTTGSGANAYVADGGLLSRSTSSQRYKQDIQSLDANSAMTAVMGMRPVVYRGANITDTNTRRHIGFIAEEMSTIAPLLVTYDEGGETGTPNYVTYDRITAYLVSVVQQQQQQIQALQEQLSTLGE